MLDMHHAVGSSAFWSKSTLRVLRVESERRSCTLATNIIFRPPFSSPQLSEIKRLCYPLCITPLSTRATHNLSSQSIDFLLLFFFAGSNLSVSFLSVSVFLCMLSLYMSLLSFPFLYLSPPPLSVSACRNPAITPWPLTWLAIHSLCFNSLWTKQAFTYWSSTGPVGEVLFLCAKSDLKAGKSVQAAFILFRLFSVIKGYCTFLAFSCQYK